MNNTNKIITILPIHPSIHLETSLASTLGCKPKTVAEPPNAQNARKKEKSINRPQSGKPKNRTKMYGIIDLLLPHIWKLGFEGDKESM